MLPQPKNILLLCGAFFFIFFGYSGVQQYLTIFFTQQQQPSLGFHSLILIYLFFSLSSPLVPFLLENMPLRRAMILSTICYALFSLFVLSATPSIIYMGSAILGIAAAVLWNALNIYLIESSDTTAYGRSSGLFSSCVLLGGVAGILGIWIIATYSSYKIAFAWASLLPLLAIIFLSFLQERRSPIGKASLLGETKGKTKASIGSVFSLTKKIFSSPLALRLSIPWFSFAIITALAIGLLPLEISKSLGNAYVGPISVLIFAAPIILFYPLGKISDHKGRKPLIIIAFLLGISGLLLLLLASTIPLLMGVLFLTLFYSILKTCNVAVVGDVASAQNIKPITSLFWTMQSIGMICALLLSLILSPQMTYLFSGIILLLLFLLFSPLLRVPWKQLKEKLAKEIIVK